MRTSHPSSPGVDGNSEGGVAQAKCAQARDELIGVFYNWTQARVDLAKATGSISAFSMQ
jgi:hypothetical protein